MKQKIYEVRIRYDDNHKGRDIVVKRLDISSIYRYTSARVDVLSHVTVGTSYDNNFSLRFSSRATIVFRSPHK